MEITYDEFIAVWQSPQQKEALDQKIEMDNNARYQARMNGEGKDPQGKAMLANMTPNQFKSLRTHQMLQLLNAYRDARSSKVPDLLSISATTTNMNDIRRVLGDKPGYIYHTGPVALDYETVCAVQHLAELMGPSGSYAYDKEWTKHMYPSRMTAVIDEMVAVKDILAKQENLPYNDVVGNKIYRETNLVKRAIGKSQMTHQGIAIPGVGYADEALFPTDQKGKNVFGIEDYSLSAENLFKRKTNIFSRISHAISGKVKEMFTDKDKLQEEKAKIGHRTMEVGGER